MKADNEEVMEETDPLMNSQAKLDDKGDMVFEKVKGAGQMEPNGLVTGNYENKDCVMFLHTHSGCKIQGLGLREWIIMRNKVLCVFDFHGSGKSEGKYVSFGFYETLDLDAVVSSLSQVVRFLCETKKIGKISLWGRSMGAATAVMYMSDKFRREMARLVTLDLKAHDIFFSRLLVSRPVKDSILRIGLSFPFFGRQHPPHSGPEEQVRAWFLGEPCAESVGQ